jgi:hypothetical protein
MLIIIIIELYLIENIGQFEGKIVTNMVRVSLSFTT